ncbi:MAG TPA: hypothetical protein VFZ70_10365 [Euzebyales bacterium]
MSRSRNPARRRLSVVLNWEIPIVLALGLVAWVVPGTPAMLAGWAMVAVLILTPIGRVGWLANRWNKFDRTFAMRAWGLLAAVAVATVVAVVLR